MVTGHSLGGYFAEVLSTTLGALAEAIVRRRRRAVVDGGVDGRRLGDWVRGKL